MYGQHALNSVEKNITKSVDWAKDKLSVAKDKWDKSGIEQKVSSKLSKWFKF